MGDKISNTKVFDTFARSPSGGESVLESYFPQVCVSIFMYFNLETPMGYTFEVNV